MIKDEHFPISSSHTGIITTPRPEDARIES